MKFAWNAWLRFFVCAHKITLLLPSPPFIEMANTILLTFQTFNVTKIQKKYMVKHCLKYFQSWTCKALCWRAGDDCVRGRSTICNSDFEIGFGQQQKWTIKANLRCCFNFQQSHFVASISRYLILWWVYFCVQIISLHWQLNCSWNISR